MDQKDFIPEHNNEKPKKKKVLFLILLIVFTVIFAVSSVLLYFSLRPKSNDLPAKYKRNVDLSDQELPDNPIDFSSLFSTNPEVIGWITVPSTEGTIIDYPILQSSMETEEDFYLSHDIDRNPKKEGSIYIQRDNASDFSDFNTLIYGHNMLNKSMFGTLKRYRNTEYFNNNRAITVYIPGEIREYSIVSAFVYDDRLIPPAFNYFMDDEQKQNFIDTCKSPNTLVRNVSDDFDVTVDDNIITLSTCTSVDTERYLVVAKLIKTTKTKK